jgi:hypothetical protein
VTTAAEDIPEYDFEFMQGSDVTHSFTITDTTGNPRDLTDYTAQSQMRLPDSASELTATYTCLIPEPLSGTIQMVLLGANSNVHVNTYVYDVLIMHVDNPAKERVVRGHIEVTRAITVWVD